MHTHTHLPYLLDKSNFKKPGIHQRIPDLKTRKAMPHWINLNRNNGFVSRTRLPLLCEKSGAIPLVLVGPMAGRQTK